eukprot:XP_798461.4 PREDICTED: RNA/RNP complex-1-interacting phosphatase [Strongylocentrotus purpuratus]
MFSERQKRGVNIEMPKAKTIPDRWEKYVPFGDVIKGTNILPLKVPLKENLSSRLLEKDRFTPDDLLQKLNEMNYRMGLIIDLTATTRYYNPEIFIDRDVQYVKVFTPGHVVPPPEVVDKFTAAVSSFKEYNKDNDMIIGVHCTHGVNRTGYLVCRYLIEREGYKPKDALKAFEEARGYPIERENYIEDLLQLSGDRRESVRSKEFHDVYFQEKGKNDYYRTRNNYDHDRRGHHQQQYHDPYYWYGGAQPVAYGSTFQRHSRWDSPHGRRGDRDNWRDRGVNYEPEYHAWQGEGAYGGEWNGREYRNWNGPNQTGSNWKGQNWNGQNSEPHSAQNKWRSHNQRTSRGDSNKGPEKQAFMRKTPRNIPY